MTTHRLFQRLGAARWTLLSAALCGGVFVVDLALPLGVAGAVAYVVPTLVSLWSGRRRHVLAVAAAGSVLTALGFVLSEPGAALWMGIVNRLLALLAIWAVAMLGLQRERLLREGWALADARNLLLGMASHDLRNPLTLMDGSLDLLSLNGSAQTPRSEAALARMRRASRAMRERIGTYLDLATLEGGGVTVHPRPVPLRGFLEGCREACAFLLEGSPARLRIDLPQASPTVILDPERMAQVIENLVTNAGKVAPPGSEVALTARCTDGEVELRVRDEGPGIPEELREALFQPFRRGGAVHRRRDSHGLGLAIARRLVEAHGGTLRAESAAGQGTTFVVSLPHGQPAGGTTVL